MIKCDCFERIGTIINTRKCYQEIESFFLGQVQAGVFEEISSGDQSQSTFEVYKNGEVKTYWHPANKWFRCRSCNCVWEFQYPDFPAPGYVKKYIEEK